MTAPRVPISVEPPMYAEALAFRAEVSADGHPGSVDDARVEHVLEAPDRAEEQLLLGRPGGAMGGGARLG